MLFSSRSPSENWRHPCGTQLTAALKPRKRVFPLTGCHLWIDRRRTHCGSDSAYGAADRFKGGRARVLAPREALCIKTILRSLEGARASSVRLSSVVAQKSLGQL